MDKSIDIGKSKKGSENKRKDFFEILAKWSPVISWIAVIFISCIATLFVWLLLNHTRAVIGALICVVFLFGGLIFARNYHDRIMRTTVYDPKGKGVNDETPTK